MDFRDFLLWERSSRDSIDFKKIYVDMTGNLVSGLILSQIIFWFLPKRGGDVRAQIERDGHLWIAKKNEDWWEECRVKRNSAIRALETLVSAGLIETKLFQFAGAPTVHIRIIESRFMEVWANLVNDPIYPKPVNGFTQNQQIDLPETSKSYTKTTTKTTTKISLPGSSPGCENVSRTRTSRKSTPRIDENGHGDRTDDIPPLIPDESTGPMPYPKRAAGKLWDALAAKNKKDPRACIRQWAESIRKFIVESDVSIEELETELTWYIEHIGEEFVPEAYSADGFCRKFSAIRASRHRWSRERDIDPSIGTVIPARPIRRVPATDEQIRQLARNS